jgi:ribosomal protein S16
MSIGDAWAVINESGTQVASVDQSGNLIVAGTVSSTSATPDDFGAAGIKADVIAESTNGAGVTIDGAKVLDGFLLDTVGFYDPVAPTKRVRLDAGTVTAGQTRVLAMPDENVTITSAGAALVAGASAAAQRSTLGLDTGDSPAFVAVTANLTGNVTGNSTGIHTGATTVPDGSVLTLAGAGGTAGDIVQYIGSSTEGMHLVVFDAIISPAAVETAVLTIPAQSVVMSCQANVATALTGGGTTVTFGVGTAGDPDKYGAPAVDGLTQNTKLNFIPAYAFLTAPEAVVLTGAAAGGTADGDTALTVGTVRVRVVYWTLNSLDNAA